MSRAFSYLGTKEARMHPIRSFCLYEFLAEVGLGMSATSGSLLQLQVGMSLSDIAFVNIIFWLVIVVMELPTGMLADGKSRIWSIRVGILLIALGCFFYANVHGVGTALLAEITLGIGMAFVSGAEEAWITDALKKRGEAHLLAKAFGGRAMAGAAGILIGGVLGALLASLWLRLAWIGAGLTVSTAVFVAWRCMDEAGEIEERVTEYEALRLSWQALRNQPTLRWSVAAWVFFGLVVVFNHLWQPFFGPEIGQPGLALVWVFIQSAQFATGWVVRRQGASGAKSVHGILFALFLSGAGLACLPIMPGIIAMMVCMSLHEFGRGLFRPFISVYTQDRIESRYRATFGSLQSLLGRTGNALALVLMWFLAKGEETSKETIFFIWTVAGILLVLTTLLLWFFRPRAKS